MLDNQMIDQLIELAIKEDVGDGDHTSLACLEQGAISRAQLKVKDSGILAGVEMARKVFQKIDPSLKMNVLIQDGAWVKYGDVAFTVEGPEISILKAERTVLNFMQRMSGIATQTKKYADALKGLKTKVLDTRKTTPGLRMVEKMAVKTGGGENHRMGLYDMILVKDNHIDFAGGIEKALDRVSEYLEKTGKDLKIEIEARNLDDVREILKTGKAHRILLDNFTPEQTKEAVNAIDGRAETESSGGITIENLREYALCGVDYISVGALTHQINSLDMSLKAMG
jgi:nicotinate-nucleotide pyrophosphorylase (carboxylating)